LISGENNLWWDSANNHLGINTNTPATALDVNHNGTLVAKFNNTTTTSTLLAFENAGNEQWWIGTENTNNDFLFYDATNFPTLSLRTTFKTSGQVLIGGGSTGSGKLVVESATSDNGIQIVGANAPSLRIDSAATGPTKRAGFGISTAANNFIQGSVDRDFCMFNGSTTASPILFGIYGTTNVQEAARISAARNFLLGTTTDTGQRLQVSGTGYISGNLGLGTTNAQFPLEIVNPDTSAIAIVSTRENATGPSYFVGRCIGGTIASPTNHVGQGAIFQSYGYRGGAYREHGHLIFNGTNATSGGGIAGILNILLSSDSSITTQIASATATSFNVGGDFSQTVYRFKVSGISQFSNGIGSLTTNILNTTTAASGLTGYGLAIESEATAATSYNLICRNIDGSTVYGGISTASGQVGFWSIGFAPTGTIGNRLSVSGAMSVGSGSYLTTAAPSNGGMIQGNLLIGKTTDGGQKLQVNGSSIFNVNSNAALLITNSGQTPIISYTSNGVTDAGKIRVQEAFGGGEMIFSTKTTGGVDTDRITIKTSGVINIQNVPTSSAGLVSGDIYRTGNILNIVP
jgi:hypothetical protein